LLPAFDDFPRVISEHQVKKWRVRTGKGEIDAANTFQAITRCLSACVGVTKHFCSENFVSSGCYRVAKAGQPVKMMCRGGMADTCANRALPKRQGSGATFGQQRNARVNQCLAKIAVVMRFSVRFHVHDYRFPDNLDSVKIL